MGDPGLPGVALLVLVAIGLSMYWRRTLLQHDARLGQLAIRVHVNGIRGKSTVTRLVAAVLREGGFVTVAKTTGSAARVIGPRGEESPIHRLGAPTINEQVDVIREHVGPDVEALVIECMAVNPLYQQYSQDYVVKSDVTIISNVREDHQEVMGETLEKIADSLSTTIPLGGVLITAEDRSHLRERLRQNAARRGCRFIYADPSGVTDEEMRGFDYLQFKENVAIGLAVAQLAGVDRPAAVRGMWKAVPDVGVVHLRHYDVRGKDVLWVPLFATNDRESVLLSLAVLKPRYPENATVIGVLNNRSDRGRRAELFAHMVPLDLASELDQVITFGAFEQKVTGMMMRDGFPRDRITNLGATVNPSLDQILDTIAQLIPGRHGVLIGMINIHTHQAELLMEHFERAGGVAQVSELELSRDPARLPRAAQRHSRAVAHGLELRRRAPGLVHTRA